MSRKSIRDPHAKAHMGIANTIRLAKRRMFATHREGGDLMAAYRRFSNEVHDAVEYHDAVAETRDVPSFVTELKSDLDRKGYSGPTRAQNDLASAVAEIITNDAAPPKLRDPIVNYISDAPDEAQTTKEAIESETDWQEWHDKRYGKDRQKLSPELIHAIARDVVNGDHNAACKMLLLMDEFERS